MTRTGINAQAARQTLRTELRISMDDSSAIGGWIVYSDGSYTHAVRASEVLRESKRHGFVDYSDFCNRVSACSDKRIARRLARAAGIPGMHLGDGLCTYVAVRGETFGTLRAAREFMASL